MIKLLISFHKKPVFWIMPMTAMFLLLLKNIEAFVSSQEFNLLVFLKLSTVAYAVNLAIMFVVILLKKK